MFFLKKEVQIKGYPSVSIIQNQGLMYIEVVYIILASKITEVTVIKCCDKKNLFTEYIGNK